MFKAYVNCLVLMYALCLNQAQADEPILILTEDLAPLQIVKDGHLVDGLAYQQVKRIVERAELKVNWLVAPWSRAYKMAQSEPNTLLFSLVRTPEREESFIWIGQLYLMDLFLVSTKSKGVKASTLDEAKLLVVGAKRKDVVLDYLETKGFTTGKNMVVVTDTTNTFNALFKGRVDLIPANKSVIEAYCASSTCSLQDFTFNIPLPDMQQDFYLVASKGTDPKIIKALRDAYYSIATEAVPK